MLAKDVIASQFKTLSSKTLLEYFKLKSEREENTFQPREQGMSAGLQIWMGPRERNILLCESFDGRQMTHGKTVCPGYDGLRDVI